MFHHQRGQGRRHGAFARAWRFLRVGHGLAVSMHETAHAHAKELEEEIEELKLKLDERR